MNVDGLWLDMNECANFCDGQCPLAEMAEEIVSKITGEKARTMAGNFDPNNPTYMINNRCFRTPLYTRTLAMDAQYHGGVLELDAHNLYGEWKRCGIGWLVVQCHIWSRDGRTVCGGWVHPLWHLEDSVT